MWWPGSELIALFYQLHCLAAAEHQSILTALDGPPWVDASARGPPLARYHLRLFASAAHRRQTDEREWKLCSRRFFSPSPVTQVPREGGERRQGGEASVVKRGWLVLKRTAAAFAVANYLSVSLTPREISG